MTLVLPQMVPDCITRHTEKAGDFQNALSLADQNLDCHYVLLSQRSRRHKAAKLPKVGQFWFVDVGYFYISPNTTAKQAKHKVQFLQTDIVLQCHNFYGVTYGYTIPHEIVVANNLLIFLIYLYFLKYVKKQTFFWGL